MRYPFVHDTVNEIEMNHFSPTTVPLFAVYFHSPK